jgi:hypothetical protein
MQNNELQYLIHSMYTILKDSLKNILSKPSVGSKIFLNLSILYLDNYEKFFYRI